MENVIEIKNMSKSFKILVLFECKFLLKEIKFLMI